MKLGFIGLGKMGSRMVMKLLDERHEVVVWNRTSTKVEEFKKKFELKLQTSKIKNAKNLKVADTIEDLVSSLDKPRVVWSMLPAGHPTQDILDEISKFVEKGDIVIDGGNSRFSDTDMVYDEFKTKGIRFLGIGVSGGLIAFEQGYPMMVGGDKSAYEYILPVLDSLAKPNGGHEYFGIGGAGHFVKMVHNAVEYGYMQSIGEGFGVLEKSHYNLDLKKVANLYRKGTLVSGFMMDRTGEVLQKDPRLEKIDGVIGKASGETIWTVEQAEKEKLPVDVIKRSLQIRNESETDKKIQKSFAARMVAGLRVAFGGHDNKIKG